MPPTCQQMEPAETPVSTTPASHAARIASSTPCSRHIASNPATEPPQPHTTSCSRRWAVMSSTLGIVNSCRWLPWNPRAWAAA